MRTPLCGLLGIDAPVIQAALGPWSNAELTAAVSAAGGLGSLGSSLLSTERVRADIGRVRELTPKPFALNLTARPFSEEVFGLALEERPRVISFAIGSSRELVERAHEAGCLFMQQIHTVRQASDAAEAGADLIVAQGGEAGGFGGTVSTMALVPQVVDAVAPVPVVAAGGIADGRGLAAALALGAQGVNVGTRFLACREAGIDPGWQRALASAESEDAVKVDFAAWVFPPASPGGFSTLPRSLSTAWIERWNVASADELDAEARRLSEELVAAVSEGRGHELVPFTGQSVGLVRDVPSAAEIVRGMVVGAAEALRAAGRLERAVE